MALSGVLLLLATVLSKWRSTTLSIVGTVNFSRNLSTANYGAWSTSRSINIDKNDADESNVRKGDHKLM
jgi:hypothetical protein